MTHLLAALVAVAALAGLAALVAFGVVVQLQRVDKRAERKRRQR